MCKKFDILSFIDIDIALREYKQGDEDTKTTNYFKYKNIVYPTMRIVKNSLKLDNQFYDNLYCCEFIIKKLLIDVVFLSKK